MAVYRPLGRREDRSCLRPRIDEAAEAWSPTGGRDRRRRAIVPTTSKHPATLTPAQPPTPWPTPRPRGLRWQLQPPDIVVQHPVLAQTPITRPRAPRGSPRAAARTPRRSPAAPPALPPASSFAGSPLSARVPASTGTRPTPAAPGVGLRQRRLPKHDSGVQPPPPTGLRG